MKGKQPKQKRYRVSFDIPIPGKDYPFERLTKVGASFGFRKAEINKVRNAASAWRKNGRASIMFLTRVSGAKGRIWRVR